VNHPILAGLLLASMISPFGGPAHRKTEKANRDYIEERYEEALRSYTEAQVDAPEAPELYYDIGNVLYRQGDYEGASEAYQRALLTAGDELVPDVAYNLGNARFQQQEFQEAIDSYQRALESQPADVDAKRNLELALQALQQQQQQQQQQPQDSEEDGEQQEQPQDQQQQEQQPKDEQQDEQQPQPQPGEGQEEPEPSPSDPQQQQQEQAGEESRGGETLSREEAERLLDSLAEEEQKNLRDAQRRKVAGSNNREKDW
jgi:tetratricopeptide (TPR) repeat protein